MTPQLVLGAILGPWVTACGLVVGSYEVGNEQGGTGSAGARGGTGGAGAQGGSSAGGVTGDASPTLGHEWPVLPARPDTAREDSCEACVRESCNTLWDACIADPWCLQMLECNHDCRDPDCLLACTDRLPDSREFSDYWDCVYGAEGACTLDGKCGVGLNFDCAGGYDWEPGDPEVEIELTVRNLFAGLGGTQDVAGIDVEVCGNPDCAGAGYRFGPEQTDPAGKLDVRYGSTNEDLYLILSGGSDRERYFVYEAPFLRDGRRTASYYGRRNAIGFATPELEARIADESRPVIFAGARDCLASPALGVEVTLVETDSFTERSVGGRAGLGDFNASLTSSNGRVAFVNVPPSTVPVTLEVHRATTGSGQAKLLARRRVHVRPDWWTEVKLYPLTRSQAR